MACKNDDGRDDINGKSKITISFIRLIFQEFHTEQLFLMMLTI